MTAKPKGANWQEGHNIREMKRTYESAEWLLRSRMDDVGYLVYRLIRESTTLSVNAEYSRTFLRDKVMLLLDESIKKHAEHSRAN
jgi:hypothetical protein